MTARLPDPCLVVLVGPERPRASRRGRRSWFRPTRSCRRTAAGRGRRRRARPAREPRRVRGARLIVAKRLAPRPDHVIDSTGLDARAPRRRGSRSRRRHGVPRPRRRRRRAAARCPASATARAPRPVPAKVVSGAAARGRPRPPSRSPRRGSPPYGPAGRSRSCRRRCSARRPPPRRQADGSDARSSSACRSSPFAWPGHPAETGRRARRRSPAPPRTPASRASG